MSTVRGRLAELRALVDEVAAPGWTASPVWWALLGAVALAEPYGRPGAYLVSNATPEADTYMGVPEPAPDDSAGRIGWALAAAHAAVRAVLARDGSLPEQPLTVAIAPYRGAARALPVASPWRIAVALAERVVVVTLDPRGPGHDLALARQLARAVRGRPGPGDGERLAALGDGPPPMLVVALGDDDPARAHHGHRRGWHDGAGSWLGLARAGGLTVVSTCHMIVDGWGHAHLTADVARGIDRAAARALAAAAAAELGDAIGVPRAAPLPAAAGDALTVAWQRLPGPLPSVTRQAWALGRVLHAAHGDPRAPRSPSFQVPVAPGAPDDPTRFTRRVRPALLSVRFSDGVPEPVEVFAARARAAIAREAEGRGLASRLLAALTAVPAPLGWKRGVVGARPAWLAPTLDVLAGAGCLSVLRLPAAPPLVAVSAPAQLLPLDAARTTSVLTVIVDPDGATATLTSTGRPTTLLEAWAEALGSSAAARALEI